jgi:hypothetical protein
VGTAVGHRLAAAGLLLWIVDVDTETFEQFKRRDADFGIEGIDKAGNEKRNVTVQRVL